jgi:flagellin
MSVVETERYSRAKAGAGRTPEKFQQQDGTHMSTSIVTNVSSIIARENLRVVNEFQGRTINRLTSGLRINSSGDDAAGLAVANRFRSDITELSQGVRNANDGLSKLQIVDGGLNNISNILDRLKTLATQSGSGTFTGDRTTLNNEYSSLLSEINRQAANVGLVSGGENNANISVYVGGGSNQTNARVDIDLSGTTNRVDSTGLGIAGTQVGSGGVAIGSVDLSSGTFLANSTQVLTVQVYDSATTSVVNRQVTINGGVSGISGDQVVEQINTALGGFGITASKGTDGVLNLSGAGAFTASAAAVTGGGGAAVTASAVARNTANYTFDQATYTANADAQVLVFSNDAGSAIVNIAGGADAAAVRTTLNSSLAALGIEAVSFDGTAGVSIQSSTSFTMAVTTAASADGFGAVGTKTVADPDAAASATGNALTAIAAIDKAITSLGQVQGRVGTAQNKLQYSVQLAQSQISSFSAAESRIRDADVALEASNLTKAQVMQQASLAALAQANSAPQAVLALLRG